MKKLLNYRYRAVAVLVIIGLIYVSYLICRSLLELPSLLYVAFLLIYFVLASFLFVALFLFGTIQDEEMKIFDDETNDEQQG